MAYRNQHHLHPPPRLCLQNRSLSAREGAMNDGAAQSQFDAAGDDDAFWQCPNGNSNGTVNSRTVTTQRGHQLSASTDQLLTECFRHNVSLLSMPRPQHHRILPSPPSLPIGGTIDREEAQLIGNGTNRYQRRSGNQRKRNDTTEQRRQEFREKATAKVAKGQWRSTELVDDDCSVSLAATDALPTQQHEEANFGNRSFCGLKSRLAFSLFGLGKSADTERGDKRATSAKKKQPKQRRSSSAVTASNDHEQQQHQNFLHPSLSTAQLNNGTATMAPPKVVPTAKRKAESTPAAANCTQNGTTTKRISSAAQQLIMSCLDKSRGDLSGRVLSRAIHKRTDFGTFCANLSAAEQWTKFVEQFHKYIVDVLSSLQNVEQIRIMSMHFGAEQVNRRIYGFKADFFATVANSLATECVFLDGASHSPTDAIEAWAELVEMMFSSVRDGYYAEVRRKRRCSATGGDTKIGHLAKTEMT